LTVDPFRFLGLAFAAADLLLEVGPDGALTFAAGAIQAMTGHEGATLAGQPWRALFEDDDTPLIEAMFTELQNGERRGPNIVRLATAPNHPASYAALSVFQLPQNAPRLSCILTIAHQGHRDRPPGGVLRTREDFEILAQALVDTARQTGEKIELGLIELGGLEKEKARLSPDEAQQLDRRIAGALRAEAYGDAATDLGVRPVKRRRCSLSA
jgi:hypothetical protein